MRHTFRIVAILIAIAAAIDPAVTSLRHGKPDVAVVVADSAANAALAGRVTAALRKDFTVIPAPFGGATATVLVGDALPRDASELASPVFAVMSDRAGSSVAIEHVVVPSTSPLDARVGVGPRTRVTGAKGRAVEFTLSAGGIVMDRVALPVASDDEQLRAALSFVPTAAGAAPVSVAAAIVGTSARDSADVIVNVLDRRWPVLFFDRRPSYMSTFVRRSLEDDSRFAVTSRVVTSRNVSTDAGQPPASLNDMASLDILDAVIVGAPESLTDADVTGLDRFMRERGGSVVLLFDQARPGPDDRVTGVASWSGTVNPAAAALAPVAWPDSGRIKAAELGWPSSLPAGARQLVAYSGHPVVWQSAVGAGRLVVSTALDSWRYRDAIASGFDQFWRTLIAEAADAAPAAIGIALARPILAPGDSTEVTVTLRRPALGTLPGSAARASVTATLELASGTLPVRLWPGATAGELHGTIRAPLEQGSYRISVASGADRSDAPLVVARGARRARPDDHDLMQAFTASRGGVVVAASELGQLGARIGRVVAAQPQRVTWYPMRSAWWIVPFALALSAEWLARRRRRLA